MRMNFVVLISCILLIGSVSFAHTVTINMKFDSSGSVYADSRQVTGDMTFTNMSKRYLMNFGSSAFGMLFAGSGFVDAGVKIQNGKVFSMTQGDDNRFVIAFTNTTWQNIDDRYDSIDNMPAKTIGSFSQKGFETFPVFLQLQYYDIDFLKSFSWSGQEIFIIANKGRVNGKTMVNIERK